MTGASASLRSATAASATCSIDNPLPTQSTMDDAAAQETTKQRLLHLKLAFLAGEPPACVLALASDEGVHWAVQNGLHLSRSNVVYFKHNDMASLASTLEKLTRENKRAEKIRRYIVVESIYQIEKIDIITPRMGNALATDGGFCTGSVRVVDHHVDAIPD